VKAQSSHTKNCDKILWEDDEKDCCSRLWVGLFVVLGFVALLFLAYEGGQHELAVVSADLRVKLKFDNIAG